jgi:Sulfite reductase, alpha subunit (flavoprotein)
MVMCAGLRNSADNLNRFEPGDVAVIHPEASSEDIETFLSSMGWGNVADSPFTIKHTMQGAYLDVTDSQERPDLLQTNRFLTIFPRLRLLECCSLVM